jgi:hypothetical protein
MGMCHQKVMKVKPLRDLSIPLVAFLFKEVIRWPQGMSSAS